MAPTAHPATETSTPAAQLHALLCATGTWPLTDTGWLRATGEDRVRWLNGMATNSIQRLQPGEGNYNFFLNVQGRIQGDASIFAEPNALLIETATAQIPALLPLLDRFIIMDDVELTDITATQSGIAVVGPQAASLLRQLGLIFKDPGALTRQSVAWNSTEVNLIHAHSPLVPRFELWADPETIAALSQSLLAAGVTSCDPESRHALCILEGTPLYGTDIRDRDLPHETSQTRALHFSKGCYLGQEIVERIRSRGNVHRTFAAFSLTGTLPTPGTPIESEGKPVGELTSIATIPLPESPTPVQLALGYIRREALDRGAPLNYPGGTATPVPVPYLAAEANTPQRASELPERE
jgi:aminomethyltransferase